jgi:hypothetical protein
MSLIYDVIEFFSLPKLSSCTVAISTCNISEYPESSESKGQLAHKAGILSVYELIV